MTEDFVVTIPSHRRPEIIRECSLGQCLHGGVDPARIYLFLSDEQDAKNYKETGATHNVHTVMCPEAKNATDKFNAIFDYFPEGTKVFVVEDDVVLRTGQAGSNERKNLTAVNTFISESFKKAEKAGCTLWGVAPHDNTFFYDKKVSVTLKLIVAHAFGFVATGEQWLRVTQPSKTDYERTLLYFIRDGKVARMPNVGVKAKKSYRLDGGMQADHTHEQRAEAEEVSVQYLTSRYPHLIARKQKASSPFAEMRFLRPPKNIVDFREYQYAIDKQTGFA